MQVSALHLPNSQLFSNDVISGVVQQRSKRSWSAFVGLNSDMSVDAVPRPSQRPRLQQWHPQTREYGEAGEPSSNVPPGRWGSHQDTTAMISALKEKLQPPATTESTARDGQLQAMVDLIIADKLRLRELRRVRQIRYRKKKDDYANSLDEGNKQLRVEIEQLADRRRSVLAAVPAKKSGWSVAVEYFRLFQFGIPDTSASGASSSCAQIAFLKATMAPDVLFNTDCGVKAVIGNWYYISQWFAKLDMELDALGTGSSGTLVAKTVTSITMTEHTIRKVFPHLTSSEDPSGMSPLAQELLDKTLVMHGATQFEWDSVRCRVGSIRSQSDMMTPLLRLLGTLDKVARVFSNALITPELHCKQ
ncbi:hypothetical protein GQ600_26219 [Phytophthora cactorum]|nr:hypothetical protein GQ600_26219 [Phytophthora cactorum]